jgi:hypothetical protein
VRGNHGSNERHFRWWFTGLKHNIGAPGSATG